MTTVPEPLDVLTLGETMALLVAQEPGPLEQVQTFSKRLQGYREAQTISKISPSDDAALS